MLRLLLLLQLLLLFLLRATDNAGFVFRHTACTALLHGLHVGVISPTGHVIISVISGKRNERICSPCARRRGDTYLHTRAASRGNCTNIYRLRQDAPSCRNHHEIPRYFCPRARV
jgi:hypothetical protein